LYEIRYGAEYEVLTAESGTEALERFGDHVDVAFFDRRMPGMSGDEIIQEIRDRGHQMPVGIISAVDPDVEPAVNHDVYLTKPIDASEVHAVVERHTS
jgi:CheY-like chemotaxis protein